MKKLNGFNNGRDTTEGIGGREPFYDEVKHRPLREHYEIATDLGDTFAVRAYIKDLEKYIDFLESQINYAKGEPDIKSFRERRERAGLTLRDVEQAIGIGNPYLSQLESGKITNPSFKVVQKLNWYYSTIGF